MKSILIFITIFVCNSSYAQTKATPPHHKVRQKRPPQTKPKPAQQTNTDDAEPVPEEFKSPFLKDVEYSDIRLKHYFQTHSAKLYDGIKKKERVFYTHLTTPAAAEPSGELDYETFPGARGFDTFLLNSLTVGLWRGLQVGIIPIYYVAKDNDGNVKYTSTFTYKWNFLSFQNWDFAFGGSSVDFNQKIPEGIQDPDTGEIFYDAHVSVFWTSFMINYFFENYPIAIGINTSIMNAESTNTFLNNYFKANINTRARTEIAYDVNYLWNDDWNYTVGFGRYKPNVFELSHTYFGVGVTVTHIRHTNWFNRVSAGIHWLDGVNRWHGLLSFSI